MNDSLVSDADWAALLGRTPDRREGAGIAEVFWFGAERVILARPPADPGQYFDDRHEAASRTGGVRLVVDGLVRAMVLPAALPAAVEVIVADSDRVYQLVLPKVFENIADEVARGLAGMLAGRSGQSGLS